MLQVGAWQLETVNGGQFLLDAGVMYGVVPKTVWEKVTPPDVMNRIPFAIHCVLARSAQQTVLIDTGYGGKMSPLDRAAHAAAPGDPIVESLGARGVRPDAVDAVVFTHLHWDHAGGATHWDESRRAVPTFPNATHFVNRMEWEDAVSNAPELAGSYAAENFAALEQSGQLVLLDGDIEVASGLSTCVTGGHTRGHQAIMIRSEGEVAIYLGDLCPVVTHMRRHWCASYDLYPLETRRRKPQLLGTAADEGWWVLWDHDPKYAASKVERHKSREFVVSEGREKL